MIAIIIIIAGMAVVAGVFTFSGVLLSRFAWFYLWLVLSFDGRKAVSVQGTFLRRSFVH